MRRMAARATRMTTAFNAAKRVAATNSLPLRVGLTQPLFNSARLYATDKEKVVAYTVDKFPGYVRNENFKEVQIRNNNIYIWEMNLGRPTKKKRKAMYIYLFLLNFFPRYLCSFFFSFSFFVFSFLNM